jgi:hypothetical protein
VNVVEIAPPRNCADAKPCRFDYARERRHGWSIVLPKVRTCRLSTCRSCYRNSNSLFRSRLQVASRCRQNFEYRPSGHPVKRHRELPQLLGNFAHAHCRRKIREKHSTALCGQARRRSAKALREVAHSQCRSYDKSYVERIMRCLRSLSYRQKRLLSNQPGYLGSAEKEEASAGHNQWPLVCFSHH